MCLSRKLTLLSLTHMFLFIAIDAGKRSIAIDAGKRSIIQLHDWYSKLRWVSFIASVGFLYTDACWWMRRLLLEGGVPHAAYIGTRLAFSIQQRQNINQKRCSNLLRHKHWNCANKFAFTSPGDGIRRFSYAPVLRLNIAKKIKFYAKHITAEAIRRRASRRAWN